MPLWSNDFIALCTGGDSQTEWATTILMSTVSSQIGDGKLGYKQPWCIKTALWGVIPR